MHHTFGPQVNDLHTVKNVPYGISSLVNVQPAAGLWTHFFCVCWRLFPDLNLDTGCSPLHNNKHASDRELQIGSKVMLRVPWLHGALEAPWEGPYVVRSKLSRVNYKIAREGSSHERLVHIANTKVLTDRDSLAANAIAVVAEEDKEMKNVWCKKGILSEEKCDGYCEGDLKGILEESKDVFSEVPGTCVTGVCDIIVAEGSGVVNLPPPDPYFSD